MPVLTLAYNSQPHRSTGLAPFELVMLRRIPNLSFQNLPPGMQVHDKEILKDGSSRVSKRQFMAQVCQRILTVVHAQRSSLQLYKRNYMPMFLPVTATSVSDTTCIRPTMHDNTSHGAQQLAPSLFSMPTLPHTFRTWPGRIVTVLPPPQLSLTLALIFPSETSVMNHRKN